MNQKEINKSCKRLGESIAFTLPALFLVVIVFYIPFMMSGYYSLTQWNGIAKAAKFVGFSNFQKLFFGSLEFKKSLIFTAKYTVIFMILTNVLAMAAAVALVQKFKLANVLRGMFFIPYIMSMTIVGFIWKFIFSQGFAALYEKTNFAFWQWSWLGEGRLAFWAVAFVGVWQSLGFYIVLYIAGLQAVSTDILEAARVDGAGAFRRFFKVTLPLLAPSVITCVFMSLTNAVKVFDIILALTKGGPGGSTYSATLDIYREAFQNNNYGLGSAKALIFFVIVLCVTRLALKLLRRREVEL